MARVCASQKLSGNPAFFLHFIVAKTREVIDFRGQLKGIYVRSHPILG